MRKILGIAAILITFIIGIYPAYANFSGSDDFNDNIKDTSKWGTDYIYPATGVALTETNSRLEYTVTEIATPNPPGFSGVERPWILNQGSYVDGWAVQLDVAVGNITAPNPDNYVSVGLYLENASDPGDGAFIGLGVFNPLERSFLANFFIDGSFVGPSVTSTTTSESAAVQIAFDSTNKLLLWQYDSDGSVGGYNWTTFRTEDIHSWNMADSSVFDIAVSTGSGGVLISSGMVTADNFRASQVPEPTTMILYGLGFAGAGLYRRMRRKVQK